MFPDLKQTGTLVVSRGVKHDDSVRTIRAGPGILGSDDCGTSEEVRTGGQVDGVNAVNVGPVGSLRHGDHVDRIASAVDYRRGRNSDFGGDLSAAAVVARESRRTLASEWPQDGAGVAVDAVGVEGVDGVMLGDDVQNVLGTLVGDRYVREIKG